MSKITTILAALLIFYQTAAIGQETTGGHIACTTERWFDDLMRFVAAKDIDSIQAYRDGNRCIVLKSGLRATILEGPGMFGSRVKFAVNGITLWGPREAIDY